MIHPLAYTDFLNKIIPCKRDELCSGAVGSQRFSMKAGTGSVGVEVKSGGADGIRTHVLLRDRQAL